MPRKKKDENAEKVAEKTEEKEAVEKVLKKIEKKEVEVEAEAETKAETKPKVGAEAEKVEEEVEDVAKEAVEEVKGIEGAEAAVKTARIEEEFKLWKPKTKLGRDVLEGRVTSIDEILDSGKKILECEIVDILMPDLKSDLILIGGRSGKGGGAQRIPIKITAAMHRSGRRFTAKSLVVVGNEDGIAGLGRSSAVEGRDAIEKAFRRAKMSLIKVKRGCGSWECECGGVHSIPYKTVGRSGSVEVILMPAPKGLGLVADDESKKILSLAGIKDVWVKTKGNTQMRINLITAVFNALRNLYAYERAWGKGKGGEEVAAAEEKPEAEEKIEEKGQERSEEEKTGESEETENVEEEIDEEEEGAGEKAGEEEAG